MKVTQIGWGFIVIIAIVASIPSITGTIPPAPIVYLILVLVSINFYKLSIELTDEDFKFSFGIGLFRRSYAYTEIEACRPIDYMPLGYGIRWRPNAIIYNVSGYKAIELSIKGKDRKVWIGCQKPEEIAAFLKSKI